MARGGRVGGVLAVAVWVAVTAGAAPAAAPALAGTTASTEPAAGRSVPPVRTSEARVPHVAASASSITGCGPPSARPVPDGRPIVVTLPPAAPFTVGRIPRGMWLHPAVQDPAWQLWFYGFMWLHPLAWRAAQDGQQKSLGALVEQMAQFHEVHPDHGMPQL